MNSTHDSPMRATLPENLNQADEVTATTPASLPAHSPENAEFSGPEPTRYGDWEKRGRCIDF